MAEGWKKQIDAAHLIEEAGLDYQIAFAAQVTVASLFYLQDMATRLGLTIHEITPQHIIEECEVQNRKHIEYQQSMRKLEKPRRKKRKT